MQSTFRSLRALVDGRKNKSMLPIPCKALKRNYLLTKPGRNRCIFSDIAAWDFGQQNSHPIFVFT
jgi:hypothetical protein